MPTLDAAKHPHAYRRKQVLYYEGNPATGLFCIQSGSVKLYKTGPEGKVYILRIAASSGVLGLESLFTGSPWSATAEMLEDGTVCYVDRKTVLELVRQDPGVAVQVIQTLAHQLQTSESERVELAQSSVRERLARLLALLVQSHGISEDVGTRIDLRLSREEMAEMIGTAQETAIRLLTELKQDGVIGLDGRVIVVRDIDRLIETANLPF